MSVQIKGAGVLSALAVVLSMGAGQAQAENKLFATDVLDAGKVDASVTLQTYRARSGFQVPSRSFSASGTVRANMAALSARYGVGGRTHVEGALLYGSQRGHYVSEYEGERADVRNSATGLTGGALSVKHSVGLAADSPLTLALGLDLTLLTDKNLGHSSYNTTSVHAAAGWQFQNRFKAYTALNWTVPEHADSSKTLQWAAGLWMPVSDSVTLVPDVEVRRGEGRGEVPSRISYTVGLGAHIQVAPQTYLRPSCRLGYAPARDYASHGVAEHDKSDVSQSVSVGLYQLF